MNKVSNGLMEEIANHQDDKLIQERMEFMVQGKALDFKVGPNNI